MSQIATVSEQDQKGYFAFPLHMLYCVIHSADTGVVRSMHHIELNFKDCGSVSLELIQRCSERLTNFHNPVDMVVFPLFEKLYEDSCFYP
ncbi:unnamed protein product [Chondrus crispus]|uniref:Uncharacterized protein n=1 Tax=Chondrus crispus TaxID=2769 RepID=R7QEB6_CHOCR|nr:unnamed protein product [Chondrus crispus]CDF36098.1 unnamed protein product [Chondrus crispus]|eukprot:XP_005715917.1 unnamed protein product [Chondrus crispus]